MFTRRADEEIDVKEFKKMLAKKNAGKGKAAQDAEDDSDSDDDDFALDEGESFSRTLATSQSKSIAFLCSFFQI